MVNKAPTYFILIVGTILVSVIGYIGFAFYPRAGLPAVSGLGLLILAVAAGVASFFSPCSFPLLVTLLARSINSGERRSELQSALLYGASLALGASLFLLITGAGIAIGAGTLFREVTFTSEAGRILRLVVGSFLLILGLTQVGVISIPFDKVAGLSRGIQKKQAQLRREQPILAFSLFGFGYILAGFG